LPQVPTAPFWLPMIVNPAKKITASRSTYGIEANAISAMKPVPLTYWQDRARSGQNRSMAVPRQSAVHIPPNG